MEADKAMDTTATANNKGVMEADKAIDTSATVNNDVKGANESVINKKTQIKAHSVNALEVEKFNAWSKDWWTASSGPYLLYTLNEIRVPQVVEKAKEVGLISEEFADTATPLKGLKILDVGCGGGFCAEALAKLGADVVGIDVSEEMIAQAKAHQDLDKTLINLEYQLIAVEDFAEDHVEAFDMIVCSEVVEHVNDPRNFVLECAKCLKYGGSMIIQTISKTIWSRLFTIYLVEYVLRMVTIGLHDYEMFITPEDLGDMMAAGDCFPTEIRGMGVNLWTKRWHWTWHAQIYYSIHGVKEKK